MPRVPHKVSVDLTKCHCLPHKVKVDVTINPKPPTQSQGRCHPVLPCHAKWTSMSRSAPSATRHEAECRKVHPYQSLHKKTFYFLVFLDAFGRGGTGLGLTTRSWVHDVRRLLVMCQSSQYLWFAFEVVKSVQLG